MPKMEELLNQKSTELTKVQNEPLWISKIDLEYAFGELKLSKETCWESTFATGKKWTDVIDLKNNSTVYPTYRQWSNKK